MAERTRTAVVGASTRPIDGVRDHAVLLADALGQQDTSSSFHWLLRREQSVAGTRSEFRTWTGALVPELRDAHLDVILLHYSVFAYSHRGVPLFVRPTMAALRATETPVITIMHELAYRWVRGGLKGKVWAATQRAALVEVMRSSSAVIVTTDFRAEWLRSRPWLPSRPVAAAPVFSNLPPSGAEPPPDRTVPVVGLFGYTHDRATVSLVLDAVRRLWDRGTPMRLLLLGAPGRSSDVGEMWVQAASSRAVTDALSFSGMLSAEELSDALASTDILLYVDISGPTSRKGTLAASLASARPLIALEGRRQWPQLVAANAAHVVPRAPDALADAIQALLVDREAREALAERGDAFAKETIAVARTADEVRGLLKQIAADGAR